MERVLKMWDNDEFAHLILYQEGNRQKSWKIVSPALNSLSDRTWNGQVQKPYVKDWSITVKKVKSQNNQWKKMVEENRDELWRGNGRRGRKRVSQWNRV